MDTNYIKLFFVLGACLPPAVVQAVTIGTLAETSVFGVLTQDINTASSGFIASEVVDYTATFGQAYQNDGIGTIAAHVKFDATNGIGTISSSASANWSDSVVNNTDTPIAYDFDFLIQPIALLTGAHSGCSVGTTCAPEVFYDIDILLNGTSIFNSSAVLEGSYSNHLLSKSGTDLGGSLYTGSYDVEPSVNFFGAGYIFNIYTDSISLGLLAPGETFTLDYIMTVGASITNPWESAAQASIGDFSGPLTKYFSGSGGSITSTVVPLPTTVWLFGSGLIGLIGLARRKKA